MAQLAIRGHATRGREVIELLEMLGGKNFGGHNGTRNMLFFIHPEHNEILADWCQRETHYEAFTLEDFLEKFPYKVGDRVKTVYGSSGEVYAVQWIDDEIQYRLDFGHHTSGWYGADELQPYKEETMEGKLISKEEMSLKIDTSQMEKRQIVFSADAPDKTELVLGDNFEINVEDGKTYVVRKKKQYPKTYKDCKVFGLNHYSGIGWNSYDEYSGVINSLPKQIEDIAKKLESLSKLLIARDAYWNIAGAEMGLGKPWKPEFRLGKKKYCVMTKDNKVISATVEETNRILAFPTEEMRDAFYENFKELIEECKELL